MTNNEGSGMFELGIIGVSGFGDAHYNDFMALAERGLVRFAAAVVINQDEERAKVERLKGLGCELFTDYRQMLAAFAGRLDLCAIPTGIHLHAPMAIAALRAGANVFVEKPVAATVQEVEAMRQAGQEAGKFVAVGYQNSYAPEVFAIKAALRSGRLGKLKAVRCLGLWPRDDAYYARNNWAGRLRSGGAWVLDSPFNNALAHYLMLCLQFAAASPSAAAAVRQVRAELYRARDIEGCDTACLEALAGPDAIPVRFYVSHACAAAFGPLIVADCERGRVEWTAGATRVVPAGQPPEETANGGGELVRPNMMDMLLKRLADPAAFVCGLDIAGQQTLCNNGAYESSPIRRIPPEALERTEGSLTVVKGLDAWMRQAFEEGKLLSELGRVPWAAPGEAFAMDGYAAFDGGKTSHG